ncbi:MAG: hypothetical protein OEZ38_12810 [Gammaproteobacteria bacterium]|nr:hypothetical protein [Gammaproteobacteria bacterium]
MTGIPVVDYFMGEIANSQYHLSQYLKSSDCVFCMPCFMLLVDGNEAFNDAMASKYIELLGYDTGMFVTFKLTELGKQYLEFQLL